MNLLAEKLSAPLRSYCSTAGISKEEVSKRIILGLCFLVAIPVVFFYGLGDLREGRMLEGPLVLGFGALLLLNLWLLHLLRNFMPVVRISALLFLGVISFELAIGAADGVAFVFLFFFPLAAYYLLGLLEGSIWVAGSFFLSAGFLLLPLGAHDYPRPVSIHSLVSYLVVSVLSFGLESSRQSYYRELQKEKSALIKALGEVRTLSGLLPICASCKKIRDDQGYWNQIEVYIRKHSDADFTHGLCPDCAKRILEEEEN